MRALDKARTLDADCLLLDLEDAVAPDAKTQAREQICTALEAGGYGKREIVVRVNGLDTDWGHDDLAALAKLATKRAARPMPFLRQKYRPPPILMRFARIYPMASLYGS